MAFIIQVRSNSGKWVRGRFTGPPHGSIETAVSAACHFDQDGLFPSGVRIVDDAGKVVVTAKSWSEDLRDSRGYAR